MWEFCIDVGGTFTDCVACSPDGERKTFKTLSSGVTQGAITQRGTTLRTTDPLEANLFQFVDRFRCGDPDEFWNGYQCTFRNAAGESVGTSQIHEFDSTSGQFVVADALPDDGCRYELTSGEDAPILAIRYVLRLRLDQAIPEVSVKLGTTRGTNALLTRNGANTAFITTAGFKDVLRIGNQDRPRLFDLDIRKPEPLFQSVVEIEERLAANGDVLQPVDGDAVRIKLQQLKTSGIETVAICLLHSFANPRHEHLVETIAREVGFAEVSTSSRLSPLIKIVSRGDTTVMDAYLNPILRQYVSRLRASLGTSKLKLMTSAGGLVDADSFLGKDSILSGPAGGVIGFSQVAQQAGFSHSIGFDMGGTSTDVARFDGTYEREFETQKAGIRVVAPMLSIETVAAGGGSVCGFDGVKLFVGPASSGADPGPACYGKGGPLTVTDLNLFLGRIVSERFPFALDRAAVEKQLQKLCQQIASSPLGSSYQPAELAEGFLEIANANVVRAIRRISVSRGYDPADYALVTFGGAGAQHACSIAAALGIQSILVHPYAGILSAYGIGLADVRRLGEQSILQTLNTTTLQQIEDACGQLSVELAAEVLAEGIDADRIQAPIMSLDLRYVGLDTVINIVVPLDGDYASAYEAEHERLYGYRHVGREIEVTVARVEVVGRVDRPSETSVKETANQPTTQTFIDSHFGGATGQSSVYLREDLSPGAVIVGPAIICESISTVVVEPGWQVRLTGQSNLVMTPVDDANDQSIEVAQSGRGWTAGKPRKLATPDTSADQTPSTIADPVLLEIFNNLFASIAEQMGETLQRTSISTNVKERLDFSCAVFDSQGNLVVNAPHIPVHLGAMSETVKRIIADNPSIAPNDVFVTNDPYRGGSHLPDVTVVTPVCDRATGGLIFFTASRAHHAEIGGIVPGSMPPFSTTLGQEGVLIRNFKLVDQGVSKDAELRELLSSGNWPSRAVHDNLADVSAQVAANHNGVQLLQQLIVRYSLVVVTAYMHHIQQAAAEKMKLALLAIADGDYIHTGYLDDGSPINVKITIAGDKAIVDFSGTGAVLTSNLNGNKAITTAAVLYVLRCLIDDDIPLNSGVLDPVEIVLPECLLNPSEAADPAMCPAMVGGNVETSQRVVDTLLMALNMASCSQGTMNNLTFGDDTFGYYETICGGAGATAKSAGADAVHTHMTNTRLTDVEVIERRYPVRVHEFSIRDGSGGEGGNRGGDGIVRRIEFLKPLKVSMLSQRRGKYLPLGLNGGGCGRTGMNRLKRRGGSWQDVGGCFEIEVNPGDQLQIETPGGGGFGQSVL